MSEQEIKVEKLDWKYYAAVSIVVAIIIAFMFVLVVKFSSWGIR